MVLSRMQQAERRTSSSRQVVAVDRHGYILDGEGAQFDLNLAFRPAFITGLNQSVVGVSRMWDAKIVSVVSEKS
jgi:hypothetical protein